LDISTTVMRNIAIIKDVLSGHDYATCASRFNISVPSVSNSLRTLLSLLKEYTDIDIMESSSHAYILEKRDDITKALSQPFPKVTLTPDAKSFLKTQYGKYFARDPAKIAADWPTVDRAFNYFSARRDALSIQNWLSHEGYLVGNVLTDDMLDFTWKTMKDAMNLISVTEGDHSFTIKKIEPTAWKTKLVFQAEIKQNDHMVTRRFSIDLIP
jgi:hypothetical protein